MKNKQLCKDRTQKIGKPCIYMILNKINNKKYIGSAIGHYQRKGQHFYMLRRNVHFNKHLQASWNKYGENNFTFSVLEFINDKDLLSVREEYYIKLYEANNNANGYNFRIYCSTNLGIKRSLESRLKQSASKKGKPTNSDYSKIAEACSKPVIGKNLHTGKIVKYPSVKAAGTELKIDRTNISKVLHGVCKTAGGYIWDFAEKSALKNSVNSGELLRDNPDPSVLNSIEVNMKEQRLIGEELTNNPNTSAEQLN